MVKLDVFREVIWKFLDNLVIEKGFEKHTVSEKGKNGYDFKIYFIREQGINLDSKWIEWEQGCVLLNKVGLWKGSYFASHEQSWLHINYIEWLPWFQLEENKYK